MQINKKAGVSTKKGGRWYGKTVSKIINDPLYDTVAV